MKATKACHLDAGPCQAIIHDGLFQMLPRSFHAVRGLRPRTGLRPASDRCARAKACLAPRAAKPAPLLFFPGRCDIRRANVLGPSPLDNSGPSLVDRGAEKAPRSEPPRSRGDPWRPAVHARPEAQRQPLALISRLGWAAKDTHDNRCGPLEPPTDDGWRHLETITGSNAVPSSGAVRDGPRRGARRRHLRFQMPSLRRSLELERRTGSGRT